jgi:hypothetical protein
MDGSDPATMFESGMISEDTSEVVSKSPRRAPVMFVSTMADATIRSSDATSRRDRQSSLCLVAK